MNKIKIEDVNKAKKLADEAFVAQAEIINRIDCIMELIFETFEQNEAYWYFEGAEEGELGDLWSHYNDDGIDIYVQECEDPMAILLNGGDWHLNEGFPTRWLFEDFEEELVQGKRKYIAKVAEDKINNKIKRETSKKEKEELIASAKRKLTKAELKALGEK